MTVAAERISPRVTVARHGELKRFVKTARGFDQDHQLIQREFRAVQAASEITDELGSPVALPNAKLHKGAITMETPDTYKSTLKGYLSPDLPEGWREHVGLIGRKLAVLHRSSIDFDAKPEMPVVYPIPAALFVHVTDGALWTLQQLPEEFHSVVTSPMIAVESQERVFIHGDLSLDNILTSEEDAVFIDWELAGMGAAVHDIASLVASFLSLRLRAQVARKSELVHAPRLLMSEFSEFCGSLLASYRKLGTPPDSRLLVQLIAIKLLARAQVVAAASIPQRALATLLVRLSANMLAKSAIISERIVFDVS